MWAGPYTASSEGSVAVTGVAEPPAGRVTVGAGPFGMNGPPKRLTLLEKPKALPVTAVTSALDGPDETSAPTPKVMRTAIASDTLACRRRDGATWCRGR